MEIMMNLICLSVILLFCATFIMQDHCSVLAMQSGRNINATPFIPRQQEQQQRQWQQEQSHLYGIPSHQHQQMQQEHAHANLYGSLPYEYHHEPIQQITPQYLDESNFYGNPTLQHHLPIPNQQFPDHLGHQFPTHHLGGHHQAIPSPPQTFSPMADFSMSPLLLSPLLPAHYVRDEPIRIGHREEPYVVDDLMNNVVDFAVKSEEMGAKPIGNEVQQSRPMNPFNTAFSSNDPLRHLTSLLQTIPQKTTSLFSGNPASIVGTSKNANKPLNPIRTISSTVTESSRITKPISVKEDNMEKLTFGTIGDNILSSMPEKVSEKPKVRGIPPGFPAKNPTGNASGKEEAASASLIKEVPKYLESGKKPPTPPSSSDMPKEAQIKPKSPRTVESSKLAIPEESVGPEKSGGIKIEAAPKSKASDSDDKMSMRKQESSSSAGVSSIKPEGALSKNKYSNFKQKGQKKNQGKQKGNNNQGQSTKITNVAPKEARKTIPAEFLLTNKGKHGKSQGSANPSEMAAKSNIFEELPTDDEELSESIVDKIKLESDSGKEKSGSSSDFSDTQAQMGSEDENFVDALEFFETKDEKKKKSAKQIKREKEIADAKAIEESAKKREQELADAKGKGKAEESNDKVDEKSTNNKEKFKAAKNLMELHRSTDRVQNARMEDWVRQWHRDAKNRGIKSTSTDSTRVTTEMLQEKETPVDHHTEIKTLLNILSSVKIMQISIDGDKVDENQAKKDIRYLLYTIQVFYEALYKYWHPNYKFHDWNEYLYIGEVFTKIGQFYTDKWANEEDVKLFERAKESFKKSMHFLSSFWIIPKYREFMESQVFTKDEGKYKFVKWMEELEQLLEALKWFNDKIKRFNRSNAKKTGSLDRLKAQFKKSTIQSYFETVLNLKLRTIFGIIYIGMDKQGFRSIVKKRGILAGLNHLQYWLPDQKANLAHIRKVMWNYFEILNYIKEKEIRADFKTHFQDIMSYPLPEGNYIEVEPNDYVTSAIFNAVNRIDEIRGTIANGNPYKITPVIQHALEVYKEHILCANFLLMMLQDMYEALDNMEFEEKHTFMMDIDERNFWHIVEKDKCIPAEENFKKIENLPEFQEFLAKNGMFKNTIDEAFKALNALNTKYKIEERRKEAMGQCDCCKPEEGYEKDSEEEKEELGKEQKLEEVDKDKEEEVAEKQKDIKVQEEPLEAAAGGEMVKSKQEE